MKNEERKVGGSSTPPTTTHCELDDLDGLDRSKSDDFAQATIERCPHDGENPFAQISRDLIRNKTISLECRMLIIYLLSMSDKWKIKMTHLVKEFKDQCGKHKVYELMNEAIEAGYVRREVGKTGNLRSFVKYYLSEYQQFKKSFRHPGSRDPELRRPENEDAKEVTIDKNKQMKKELMSDPPASGRLAHLFFNTLQNINPTQKLPNFDKWAKEFDKMMRIDGRTEEGITAVIKHMVHLHKTTVTGYTWFTWVQSPEKLREKYDKLSVEMNTKSIIKVNSPENDEKLAEKVLRKFSNIKGITVGYNYIEFDNGTNAIPTHLEFGSKDFTPNVLKEVRKRNLPTDGL